MKPNVPLRRIVICGHRQPALDVLASALQAATGSALAYRPGRSAVNVDDVSDRIVLTAQADDVLALKSLPAARSQFLDDSRIILVTRDPRVALLEASDEVRGQYALGYDHAIHLGSRGIVTYSGSGYVHSQQVLEAAAKRYANTLVLREDVIDSSPDVVRHALTGFLGLDIGPEFLELARPALPGVFDPARLTPGHRERLVRQFRLSPTLFDMLERQHLVARGDRDWFDRLVEITPEALDDTPGTVVGYFTLDTRYEAEAARLRGSVERLGLPIELRSVPPMADWLEAVRCKAKILMEMRERMAGHILYVDADAVVHADPWPYLRGMQADIAVAGHRNEAIISGTILINDTVGARTFLKLWAQEIERTSTAWDQHALETLVRDHQERDLGVSVGFLPPELCRVFDRRYNPPVEAVIEHLQASRERSEGSIDGKASENLDRRRRRIAELDGIASPPLQTVPQGSTFAALSRDDRRTRTLAAMAAGRTDMERWSETANLKPQWASRAVRVADLIEPGTRVLDLGCGAMDLRHALPDECTYLPSDVVARDDATIVFDLNGSADIPEVEADVVTMLGVLEYCLRPAEVLQTVAARWARLVVTYNPADLDRGRDRRSHGWVNDLASAELVQMAKAAGFTLQALVPHGTYERIYAFERSDRQ